jgi:beta-lactamase class A/beta-lactamase class A VEB
LELKIYSNQQLNNQNEQQLSADSHRFLWDVMKGSKTGSKTIRAGVPKGTVVAHKTGHSGKNNEGVTGAQNDIGIIFLPDGRHYYLSILVSNSVEIGEVNRQIISGITRLTWQFFIKNEVIESENYKPLK